MSDEQQNQESTATQAVREAQRELKRIDDLLKQAQQALKESIDAASGAAKGAE